MEFARVALMPFVLPRGIAARRLFDCRNAGLTSFLLRTIRCDIMTDMTSRRKTLKRDWFDNQLWRMGNGYAARCGWLLYRRA